MIRCCCVALILRATPKGHNLPTQRRYVGKIADRIIGEIGLKQHAVDVRTCVDLYNEWRHTKPFYRNAPDNGIVVNVPYVSTLTDDACSSESPPLAVLLHGAPGSFWDFSDNLIPTLRGQGVDILAPKLPNLAFSAKNTFFWHTVEERTALLKDWLMQLGVKRIDTLVAHSAGVYPAMRIILEGVAEVKSLVLLAPNSHLSPRAVEPIWLTSRLVSAYKYPSLRPWIRPLIWTLLHIGPAPLKPVIDDVMLSLITFMESRYKEGDKLLKQIAERHLPTLVIISKNDRLLQYKTLTAVCEVLGRSEEDFWCYDDDLHLISKGTQDSWPKVVCFDKGTHFPFIRYPDICGREVVELLGRIGSLPEDSHHLTPDFESSRTETITE
ncbi:uncharacterized protein LOC135395345 [Ornithodoros turicata]|uniref:uncharacterized protein LOC135395345 n=1 Tax=Ornithodoros turicata TaxID=34597 RepID=UPI003138B9A1